MVAILQPEACLSRALGDCTVRDGWAPLVNETAVGVCSKFQLANLQVLWTCNGRVGESIIKLSASCLPA
jgi:hypothetical protein